MSALAEMERARAERRKRATDCLCNVFFHLVCLREAIRAHRQDPCDLMAERVRRAARAIDREQLEQAAREFTLVDGIANRITVLVLHLDRITVEAESLEIIERAILDLCKPIADRL